MIYKIVIERKAEKEAEKIPIKYRAGIDKAILSLVSNPRPHGSKKLTEKEGYRIRFPMQVWNSGFDYAYISSLIFSAPLIVSSMRGAVGG